MLRFSSESEEPPVPIHKVGLDLLLESGHDLQLLHQGMIHMALGQRDMGPVKTILGLLPQ